jgi:spore maturation protein CgeB
MKKIFFVAVFDDKNISTNNSQARGFEALGHKVFRYSFRDRATKIGDKNRDLELINIVEKEKPDLVVFSKCAEISLETIERICKNNKTCYWYMDPITSLRDDFLQKAKHCSFVVTAISNTLDNFLEVNENSYLVYEGFDHNVDRPHNEEKKLDVTFIGSLHSNRMEMLMNLNPNVINITGAFGNTHAVAVATSKINLNVSTAGAASDRIFKVLAAGGFLMSTDWVGREELFVDGEHLVIYKDKDDLQEKITYYLTNYHEAEKIAAAGLAEVQKYNRDEWAKNLIEIHKEVQNEQS